MTPQEQPQRPEAFWGYQDLMVFASFGLMSFVASLFLAVALSKRGAIVRIMLPQLFLYLLTAGSLYVILHLRYPEPFWRSLGINYPNKRAWACAVSGPVLAIALGSLALLLHAREIPLPFDDFRRTPAATIALGALVVLLGPFWEELVFRGFLMPLLVRTFTALPGILLTATLFGFLHGFEYQWSWQHILVIGLAGVAFGYGREFARSTTAAFLMHATFNLAQFAGFLFSEHTRW